MVVVAALVIHFVRSGRVRFSSESISEPDRLRIATHIRQAVERAGGDDVWVKAPPYAPFPPVRAGTAVRVLVTHSRFEATLTAVQAQAAIEKLQVTSKVSRANAQRRFVEIRILRGRATAGSWLLEEVPRIRHAAIVIDDLGQDMDAAHQTTKLPYPITCAILPDLAHSSATAEEAHRSGREVMLHLPMEPESAAKPGPGEIRIGMGKLEVAQMIDEDLSTVPFVVGVNNHMGSRATTDTKLMTSVIDALAERHLFFVDSRTTNSSVALDVARRRGIPTFYRSVFLDDVETVPYTLGQLREFLRVVQEQDAALAIGHPHPTTLKALEQFLSEFERSDIQIVPASQLLRMPVIARLSPPHENGH